MSSRPPKSTLAVAAIVVVSALLSTTGCVESLPSVEPNSDEGHLFVDLDSALAVGWEATILVRGPLTGEHYCDEEDCFLEHHVLQIEELVSSDQSVFVVNDFQSVEEGAVQAVAVDIEVVDEGQANLEFSFFAEGYDPQSSGEADEESDTSLVTDSFGVEARPVDSIHLARFASNEKPKSPYRDCPEHGAGTHLFAELGEESILVRVEKRDEEANLLRGSGKLPVEIEPADAVDVDDVDEARHLVAITPVQWGPISLIPEGPGSSLEFRILSTSDVTDLDVQLWAISESGDRMHEAEELVADFVYEMEVLPAVPPDAPLCQGAQPTSVESLTPAICDVVGILETTENPAVVGFQMGECHLEVRIPALGGPDGLRAEVDYTVIFG